MANLYLKSAGGNWSAASTWSATSAAGVDNAGPPTAADDVILELGSGQVTIDATAVCRSLDCTSGVGSYTGTLTHTTLITLSIGDGTAGAGNVALKFAAGMTYTRQSSAALNFISTSATQQTITLAGKTNMNSTFSGVSGSWIFQDAWSSCASITLTNGTLNTNSQTIALTGAFNTSTGTARTLTLGSSSINLSIAGTAWSAATITNLTVTANTATVTLTGAGAIFNSGTINWNGLSVVLSGSGIANVTGAATLANLTRTGTAVKTDELQTSGAGPTITGTLTITGNSAINRVYWHSSGIGTSSTNTAAAVSLTNVDFADITAAGAAIPWTGTSLGNAGGNSNITFDTPVTQTHTASAGGNWSDVTKWASRVPLPQDNVVVDVNTTGTLTGDMPRLGANITYTGFTGTYASSLVGGHTNYGDLTVATGMTFTTTSGPYILAGRGAQTITSSGKSFGNTLTINAATGSYTAQDAITTAGQLAMTTGTFNANNLNMTGASFSSGVSTINMGSGTWTITGTSGTVWSGSASTTVNAGTSTIVISVASASSRTFAGGFKTYNILTYTVAGSTGSLAITSSNTFSTINFSDATNARTLTFTAGSIQTLPGTGWNVNGTAGKLMTVSSNVGGTPTNLNFTGRYALSDYLSVQDITASGNTLYAGVNSTNVSGNTNVVFGTPGSGGSSWLMMGVGA